MAVSTFFKADPAERLIALKALRPRRQFVLIIAICVLLHAVLITALFLADWSGPLPQPQEETAVDVIVVPPPPQEQPAPPPPPPPPPPEKKEEKPKPKPPVDLRPAYEIPRTETNKTEENESQDKETQGPQAAKDAEPPPAPTATPQEKPPAAEEPASQQKPPDERPDLEALDKAERPTEAPPKPKAAPPTPKAAPADAQRSAMARQFAALKPAPNFSVGAAAKPSPVGGGTGKATYTAILLGLITQKMHAPHDEAMRSTQAAAVIAFWLDDRGDLTHQVLVRTSGFPAFDAAAVQAVRRAAPFPPPPAGVVPSFTWNVSVN